MPSYDFLDKYPKTKQVMESTGMTLDQLLIWTEQELLKQEIDDEYKN